MKWRLMMGAACLALLPAALVAQTPAPATPPAGARPPPADPADGLTGRPPGVPRNPSHNSVGFPAPNLVEGQPIETRAPEKTDDAPLFPQQTRAPYHASVPFTVTTITTQLKMPWSLGFLPDGKMLITEKPGNLRIVDAQGTISQPITGLPPINAGGQVGLLDVALDNKFATTHRIFFSFSEPVGDHSNIAVARATLNEAGLALSDVQVIFHAKPALDSRAVSTNQGGKIVVAPDGNIFAIIGDRASVPPWDMSQKLDTDLGKLVHITQDGAPAPGNPFAKTPNALPEIYTLGQRSEEGLAFDGKGQLWDLNDGPRGGDSFNLIKPGANYGWPLIIHGIDYSGDPIREGVTHKDGLEQPVYYWDPVIAPSGLAFYNANLFPAWKGSVFVGALRGMMLDHLTLKDNKVVAEEPLLVDLKERIRDVRVGPEGALYVLTDSGKLLKLTPK